MAIWDIFRRKKEAEPQEKGIPIGGLSWLQEVPGWSRAELVRQYAQHNWVYAVVSKIAQAVSAVDWRLYAEDSEGNQIDITEGPIYSLLQRPNPFTSWQELIELTQIYLELTGEAFWVLTLNARGEPTEIWTVMPDRISIVTDPEEFIKGYVYRVGTEEIPLDPQEVIHFKYPNPADPYRGLGPVKAATLLIQNDKYAQEYTNAFFYNSAMPSGIIKVDKQLSVKQFLELKERWNAQHRGVNKAHKIAVLDNGAEFVPLSYSIKDLQLVDVRKQNRDDILATFGVHASILGISENVNRANAEAAEYTFAKRIVEPRLQKIAGKINSELLSKWKGIKVRFEFLHEIPEDTDTLLRKVQVGVQLGLMTVNEARNLLGLDDIEGGDMVMQPMNLLPTPVSYASETTDDNLQEMAGEEQGITEEENATGEKGATTKSVRATDYKAIIWKRFVREQQKHERKFKETLKPAWRLFKQEVEKAIKNGGGLEAVDYDVIIQKMGEQAKKGISETFEYFARQGKADAKALQGAITKMDVDFSEWDDAVDMTLPHIIEWLEKYPFIFAQQVTETTIEMLRKELQEALRNHEGINEIMKRVARVFDLSEKGWRAERIARTETIRAANKGTLEGYRQAGVRKKEWVTALDERTREWHAEADGQIVGIDEPFIVGGEQLMYPGDPNGSPENTINCRCTVAPVIE